MSVAGQGNERLMSLKIMGTFGPRTPQRALDPRIRAKSYALSVGPQPKKCHCCISTLRHTVELDCRLTEDNNHKRTLISVVCNYPTKPSKLMVLNFPVNMVYLQPAGYNVFF
jgi:hypothetical protein